MICQQEHIDQPMSLLDSKLRQGGRYGHYYFDLDGTSATVFPNFYRSRSRDFLPTDDRLDFVHSSQNRNRYPAVCRSVGRTRPRCLSPLFPRCPLEHGKVVAIAGKNANSSILSNSMVWLWYLKQKSGQRYFIVPPWCRQKLAPSFADALSCLRRELWRERIKCMFGISAVHDKTVEFLLEALAPAAWTINKSAKVHSNNHLIM